MDKPAEPNVELARRFFDAVSALDSTAALACCAEGCTFMRPDVGHVQDMSAQLGQLLGGLKSADGTITYTNLKTVATTDGFVEEHQVEVQVLGKTISMPVCAVAEVAGGRITALREWLDPKPLAALGG
ncbi:MAG: nuclear transport factor 2 family protein [Acidimicrobiales bacterium]